MSRASASISVAVQAFTGSSLSASSPPIRLAINQMTNHRRPHLHRLRRQRHVGEEEVLETWRGFFEAFPDYRNVWTDLVRSGGR
jgi:hypothetical protein